MTRVPSGASSVIFSTTRADVRFFAEARVVSIVFCVFLPNGETPGGDGCGQVEALEGIQLHRAAQPLAVGDGGCDGRAPRIRRRIAFVPGCDHDTGDHAFEVPLPGAVRRLVEIVEVEDHRALGGGEESEVGDVGVAADDDLGVRVDAGAEVGGLDGGAAAVERERAGEHAAGAQRNEVGQACRVLRLEDAERVAIAARGVLGVGAARDARPRRPPVVEAFLEGDDVGVLETKAPGGRCHGVNLPKRSNLNAR